jgi:hypothetical protein
MPKTRARIRENAVQAGYIGVKIDPAGTIAFPRVRALNGQMTT